MSTDYISFSLFGIYFTYITGLLIVTTSYILEPIFSCLYRRKNYEEYTYLDWTATGTLQLQRVGYQGLGSGMWSGYTDTIPRTQPGDIMEDMPRSYPVRGGRSTAYGSPEQTSTYSTQVANGSTAVKPGDTSTEGDNTEPCSDDNAPSQVSDDDPVSLASSTSGSGSLAFQADDIVQAVILSQSPLGTPTQPSLATYHIPRNIQSSYTTRGPSLPQFPDGQSQ